jgi:hypothetical protein
MEALAAEDRDLLDSFELSSPSSDYGTESTSPSTSPPSSSPPSPSFSLTKATEFNTTPDHPPISTTYDLSTSFQNDFFQTLPSPLGGIGSFAAKDLYRGDIILRERPLLVTDHDSFYDKFGELSDEERNVFETLCVSGTSLLGTPKVKAIWETNW